MPREDIGEGGILPQPKSMAARVRATLRLTQTKRALFGVATSGTYVTILRGLGEGPLISWLGGLFRGVLAYATYKFFFER